MLIKVLTIYKKWDAKCKQKPFNIYVKEKSCAIFKFAHWNWPDWSDYKKFSILSKNFLNGVINEFYVLRDKCLVNKIEENFQWLTPSRFSVYLTSVE